MGSVTKQREEVFEDLEQTLAMNPNLSLDELNVVVQQQIHDRNHKPMDHFCGLSSNQMQNWLYAPFQELTGVGISTPTDYSLSPVMRYLELIINQAMEHDGRIKATPKGDLPTKIVKAASALRAELVTSDYPTNVSISEFAGSNEDKARNVQLQPLFEQTFKFEAEKC